MKVMLFNKMNKVAGLVVVSMLSMNVVGCTVEETEKPNVTIESTQEQEKTTEEMNLVLMDNEYCKVTIVGAYNDEMYGTFGYIVETENKCNQDISVMMENTSVDGFMEEPWFCANVTAGNTSQDNMEFYRDNQGAESLEELTNVKSRLYVCETEEFNTIAENQITIDK